MNKHCIQCNSYILDGIQFATINIDKRSIERAKNLHNAPDLICPVCKTHNIATVNHCIQCGAWLLDEYWKPSKSDNGDSQKLPPSYTGNPNSEDDKVQTPSSIGSFWWLAIGFISLLLFSGSLESLSDWALLAFLIAGSALIAGLIHPVLVVRMNPTRRAVFKATLPMIMISLILFSITSEKCTEIRPQDEAVAVPAITYNNPAENMSRDFEWKYDGATFNWQVESSSELVAWDKKVIERIGTFFNSNGYVQKGILQGGSEDFRRLILSQSESNDISIWVTEEANYQWTGYLAERLHSVAQEYGYDYFHTAEFILSFVGSAIPYQLSAHPQLPAQTVFENGDCLDKSILLASILRHLDYKVVLLDFPASTTDTPGHMAVGVAFDETQVPHDRPLSYFENNGYHYYFAETTAPNWRLGQASVEKPATIFQIE